MAGESTVQDKAATDTGAQPSSTAADNKVHVDRHEYETLVRNSERLKGNDALFRKAQEAGFKDPADFDKWKPALDALKKHDPQMIAKVFGDREEETPANEVQKIDPKKLKDELRHEFRTEQALERHEELRVEEPKILKEVATELLGAKASEREVSKFLRELRGELSEISNRERYPAGHPLAEHDVKPVTAALARKIAQKLLDEGKEEDTKSKASEIHKKAVELKTTTSVSVAGNSGGNGKPNTQQRAVGKALTDDEILAAHAEMRSRRSG